MKRARRHSDGSTRAQPGRGANTPRRLERAPRPATLVAAMVWGAALALQSCASDGTKTGNGVQLEFAVAESGLLATADAGAAADERLGDAGTQERPAEEFRILDARLFVSEVRLRGKSVDLCAIYTGSGSGVDCAEGRIRVRRVMTLDLLRPERSELNVTFPASEYDRVEVRFDDGGEAPGGERASLIVEGVFGDPATGPRVLVASRRNDDLRFDSPEGVSVLDEQWLSAQVDVKRWMTALPLLECIDRGDVEQRDGRYVFDDDSECFDVPRLLWEELGASTRLNKKER